MMARGENAEGEGRREVTGEVKKISISIHSERDLKT